MLSRGNLVPSITRRKRVSRSPHGAERVINKAGRWPDGAHVPQAVRKQCRRPGAASKILRRRIVLLRGFGALSRPVTVDGVGEEYGGADNAEKRGDGFQ